MEKEKLLDQNVISQIREAFAELKQPVQILFFGSRDDCEYCEPTQQLLEELTETHEQLSLAVYDLDADRDVAEQFHVDKAPAVVIAAKDGDEIKDYGIQFAGIPSGHEFSTLISDILMVSRRDSGLSAKTREYLQGLTQPLLLQVFVTPT
jgi:glutaredoxin-like protein